MIGPATPCRNAMLLAAACLAVLLVAVVVSAQVPGAQVARALTNEDVVKMVAAQIDRQIILTAIHESDANFDLSPAGLIGLKDAGVGDEIVRLMQSRMAAKARPADTLLPGDAPEKSELLATAKEHTDVLRTFKTMFVDASAARFFGSDQMKAALGKNDDFAALKVTIVQDQAVADVVLRVGYTFAWDYPFTITHQNTTVVLVSGKGVGPFSGPKGASSVASEVVKALKPYRNAPLAPR